MRNPAFRNKGVSKEESQSETSLLCLLSVGLEHILTNIRFWYSMLSLGMVIRHLRFLRRIVQ